MRRRRRAADLAVAVVCAAGTALGTVLCAALASAVPLAAPARQQPAPGTVVVQVMDVSDISPAPTPDPQPITVRLRLTNTGTAALTDLTVDGARGNPIANQSALDAAIAKPSPPDPTLAASFAPTAPIKVSLAAGQSIQLDYDSTSSLSAQGPGLCLCEDRVYPLYFAVHANIDGGDVVVGSAQSFVVSFPTAPQPMRVGWLWPILEPPHRITQDDVFTDDSLASSVSDGRLSRLLDVLATVAGRVRLTVVLDPDLIDELAVMAGGHYSVLHGATTTPGTGAVAAQAWLARLRTILDGSPGLQVAFTPPANPDVASLTAAGLPWAPRPSAAQTRRITTALGDLGGAALLSWPARGTLTAPALQALARAGVSGTVLSPAAAVASGASTGQSAGPSSPSGPSAGPLSLSTPSGTVVSPGTTDGVAAAVDRTVPVGGRGTAGLPELVAQVAVHAVADPQGSPYVAVVPPPNLDPDPAVAERAILATTTAPWAQGVTLGSAAAQSVPAQLTDAAVATALPRQTITTARRVAQDLPGLRTLFVGHPADVLDQLPAGVQRSESAAWLGAPAGSQAIAAAVSSKLEGLLTGVYVVRPANGSYTLGSADSPLPITVQNTFPVAVRVRLSVTAAGGIFGFSATDLGVQQVAAGAKLALHVPVRVDRAGRIKVQVQLLTPSSTPLGNPVVLSVRSTALGEIGQAITVAAAVVLGLALLVRLLRWLRRRRRLQAGAQP
ncbi:MAG: hypothetical protein EPN43_01585 [Jatrophihabitans sp.]|nr:MAG: hypothetical protein EPN43_01585 [Jatrophihabitans sp.]